jgi:hypothetical protein
MKPTRNRRSPSAQKGEAQLKVLKAVGGAMKKGVVKTLTAYNKGVDKMADSIEKRLPPMKKKTSPRGRGRRSRM